MLSFGKHTSYMEKLGIIIKDIQPINIRSDFNITFFCCFYFSLFYFIVMNLQKMID